MPDEPAIRVAEFEAMVSQLAGHERVNLLTATDGGALVGAAELAAGLPVSRRGGPGYPSIATRVADPSPPAFSKVVRATSPSRA
jgi:hypothetical protein